MSKKKFKAGLESLFGDSSDDQLPGIRPLLVEEEKNKSKSPKSTTPGRKRRASKTFMSDLDDLFHAALETEIEKTKTAKSSASSQKTAIKKRTERPIIGIDALIRKTRPDNVSPEKEVLTPKRKRVTITLEKKKVERLKSIARAKKAYLKDIMDEIISKYLEEEPPANRKS